MEKALFTVDGLHCSGCAERLRTVLEREPGVGEVRVRVEAGRAEAVFDPRTVGTDRLTEIIEGAGFQVVEAAGRAAADAPLPTAPPPVEKPT